MARHRSTGSLPDSLVLSDPRALGALAHPARIAIIDELYQGRERTATELSEVTGLTPSATSYHLRALEKWGIVRRADPRPDERERPWVRASRSLSWSSDSTSPAIADSITAQYLDRLQQDFQRWSTRRAEEPAPWREAATVSRGFPFLTATEVAEVSAAVTEIVRRIAGTRDARSAPPDARRVAYFWGIVPVVED